MGSGVDPRPAAVSERGRVVVMGRRCAQCAFCSLADMSCCPLCQGALAEQAFGPYGEVTAHTVCHVGLPGRPAPYGLAYLVLDDGPRVLVHVDPTVSIAVGDRLEFSAITEAGDLVAAPVGGSR